MKPDVSLNAGGPVDHYDAHDQNSPPYYPMEVMNGYLTAASNRHNPSTDIDLSPREFRRFVEASGAQNVQLNNGLYRGNGSGRRITFVNYLYAAGSRIPGQDRDNYGGYVKNGIGPLEYQNLFRQGPGSQPQSPGGVRQILGGSVFNPGTSLWQRMRHRV
jgi:hypothetical protein